MISIEQQEKQIEAEMALFKARYGKGEEKGFSLNPLGYSSFGSWFTSANSGLWLSKAADMATVTKGGKEKDPFLEKWYVERGWVEFGANQVDEELELYRQLGETRDFTRDEYDTIKELQRRKETLTNDLHYVYNNEGGDFDAVIDEKGQSLNERWGIDPSENAGVMDFLKMLKDNPTYTLGLFTSEMIKDLPLSVLAYVGLTSKTVGGASALNTAVRTLNKIEPKIMRGIAKMSTGVGASALAGAGYEAAYTYGTQGDVKGERVKTGAKFGAAFGILAGLGLLRSKGGLTTAETKAAVKTPEKPIVDEVELEAVADKVIPVANRKKILTPAEDLAANPNQIFPELAAAPLRRHNNGSIVIDKDINAPKDYVVVDLNTPEGKAYALQMGWTGKGRNNTLDGFTGVKTIIDNNVAGGMPHIVIDRNRTGTTFNRLKNNFSKHVGEDGKLRKVSPSEYVFLKSEGSFNSFLFAREKAKIKQNQTEKTLEAEGKATAYLDADGKEVEINQLAAEELRRAYDDVNTKEFKNRSDEDLDNMEAEVPDLAPVAPVGVVGRSLDYLEANPLAAAGAAVGTGAVILATSGEDTPTSDKVTNTVAAMLAVGLGAKARAFTKGAPLNRITANIKAQISRGLEVDAATAKAWEANVQGVTDRLDAQIKKIVEDTQIPRETVGLAFTSFLEGGMIKRNQYIQGRNVKIDDELVAVAKKYREILDEIGEQAVESKLIKSIGTFNKLKFGGRSEAGSGAFLSNYIPHIFRSTGDLPDEVMLRILGKIDSMQTRDRTIQGTLAEIKRMIDEEEFIDIEGFGRYVSKTTGKPWAIGSYGFLETDPIKLLSIYTQGMTRAIIGRNTVNSMRKLDMAANGKKPTGYDDWDGGNTGNKADNLKFQNYASRKVMPAVTTQAEFEVMRDSGRYTKQELAHYKSFNHPALNGYMAHNNVKNILDDFFVVAGKEGLSAIPEGLLKVSNGLKRVFVFGSLFHSQALLMSAVYALGPLGAIKGALPKSMGGARGKTGSVEWLKLQLGTQDFYNLASQAIKDGLQVVNIRKQELVNPGKPDIDPLLDLLGPSGRIARKGFDAIDTLTWEYLHDRFKLATYLRHKERAMKRGLSEDVAGRKAATFANDAFGSLDFNDFSASLFEHAAKNPDRWTGKMADTIAQGLPANKRRWLNLFLFAPDWTISNIRIIGKTFTGAAPASKIFYQKMLEGKNWNDPKAQEILAAWQMYAGYTARAGMYTSALWWGITSIFSDEKPTAEGLWNFWFGENSGKLELGDGTSVVISKQIAEPIHFLQHFQHTLSNKGAIIPKTMLEAMYNKQWFSLKQGMPLGPRIIDEDGTSHVGKWLLGKVVPISVKPIIQAVTTDDFGLGEGFLRAGQGFLGFPRYGKKDEYNN